MFSFHGFHSGKFCLHARDTLEEMVEEAYQKGGKVIGITEHMPRYRIQDLYPEETNKLEQLVPNFEEYHRTAVKLKEQYREKMEILVGFECEYISDCDSFLDYVLGWYKKLDFDYFVGSIHHVKGIPIDINQELYNKALESCENEESLNERYYDEQYEMLLKLEPVTVGHFDLIRLFKTDKVNFKPKVWNKIIRNIDFIAKYGGIVELNTKAYKKGLLHPYPQPKIVAAMNERNIKFTLADDCHSVKEVFQYYDRIFKYCIDNGINSLSVLNTDLTTTSVLVHDLIHKLK
eukprot:NODE_788_length_4230_cov_0.560881.p2 type:complete len:290 gc:universal NODE_788_length_4230_cov_0.560881:993-124(-)